MGQNIIGSLRHINIKPLGDSAIIVQFGTDISPEVHLKVKAFSDQLDKDPFCGFVEYVPAFTSVTVFYHPLTVYQMYKGEGSKEKLSPYKIVHSIIEKRLEKLQAPLASEQRVVEIPVCYDGELGPDLQAVADYHSLSTTEVIEIHSKAEYLVFMIGFAPGFPYLGGMSEQIATPRHTSPRLSIPAGSVGIAGMQTGVYPISTPGGWQIIGRTPVDLFYPDRNPPSLLQSGDIVRFMPISIEEYNGYKETLV